jgi:hypothetical protein
VNEEEQRRRGVLYNQAATIFGYQNDLYGEWLVDGDNGTRPCRLKNWSEEDLVSFVGGEYAKAKYGVNN